MIKIDPSIEKVFEALVESGEIDNADDVANAILQSFLDHRNGPELTPEQMAELDRRTALADQGIGMKEYDSVEEYFDHVRKRLMERMGQSV